MQGAANIDDLSWVVVLATISMLYMAWGIGANDVANAFGPAFGARSLTIRQACIIAAACEGAGAILMGGSVSDTIRKGMMDVSLYAGSEGRILILAGMTSVLLAAATWLLVASRLGLPVSTTHSAVGGVIALAIASKGYESVNWPKVGMIIASWFISPVMSALTSCLLYTVLRRVVLEAPDSQRRAKLAAPVFVFFVTFIVALFTVYKGGKGLGLHKTSVEVAMGASIGIAALFAALSYPFVNWWSAKIQAQLAESGTDSKPSVDQAQVSTGEENSEAKNGDIELADKKAVDVPSKHSETEQLFTGFVVIIAGFFSLAHGANDVANSVGPFAAVLSAYEGELQKKSEIPLWVFVAAGAMIVVGLATYGIKVMTTIGTSITPMTPPKAFIVNFASTLVVLLATRFGIPVSTTHASVGAVLGVGVSEGVREVDWKVMSKVFLSWILTLPIVGITASGIFGLLLPAMVRVPYSTAV